MAAYVTIDPGFTQACGVVKIGALGPAVGIVWRKNKMNKTRRKLDRVRTERWGADRGQPIV